MGQAVYFLFIYFFHENKNVDEDNGKRRFKEILTELHVMSSQKMFVIQIYYKPYCSLGYSRTIQTVPGLPYTAIQTSFP